MTHFKGKTVLIVNTATKCGFAPTRPLPVETTMYITTSIEKTEGKKVYIMGKMFDGNGVLFADSKGIFVKIPNERIGL